jgi:hypothetical protein
LAVSLSLVSAVRCQQGTFPPKVDVGTNIYLARD